MADFVGSGACPCGPFGMPRCPPSPGSKGRADRPARQQKGARAMTEASVSFAGNLTDDPELWHTEGGIARATFRVAVSGRTRDSEPSFFTVVVWRDQAEDASARSLVEVVAEEVGPSLRWAIATPVRATRSASV